ncbi:uncharacterized protein LOC115953911 [Quercus lobata]|uniref:uncharacterized protein LOC115953911 n=1 Tax=Quercus lobata TaxID=97700 RepID=UPI001247AE4A|nr:uncharacterized protein LOC115953911 [Quercus lobata]
MEDFCKSLTWQPPEGQVYKLNFDATLYADLSTSGVGVIIRNDRGQVMVVLLSKGGVVLDSEEAESLACRKALEFAIDPSFSDLIVEGDNTNVMNSITSGRSDLTRLGNIYDDIHCLAGCLRHVEFNSISCSVNGVAYSLAR